MAILFSVDFMLNMMIFKEYKISVMLFKYIFYRIYTLFCEVGSSMTNFKKDNFIKFIKLSLSGIFIGVLGGFVGGCFAYILSVVTSTRETAPRLIWLLPLGSIATVALYRAFRMEDYSGANKIIKCLEKKEPVRPVAAPLVFISAAVTHLFGGSAGREGAALQLGGAGASALCDVFGLKNDERTVFIISGMSAVFAGVFGTPLTAAFFMLEFRRDKKIFPLSVLPCFASALTAAKISSLMGTEKETAIFTSPFPFTVSATAKVLLLSFMISILGALMCFVFRKAEFLAKKFISNPFIRGVAGSVVLILLTILVGDMRYSGSGMHMALGAVAGKADWYDFILKIIFTAVTLSAGFRGGEIVPTFCIGATFGCFFGGILGLDAGFAAALGLIGLFCNATSSPISAVVLAIEMFGFYLFPYTVPLCLITWLFSGKHGLFCGRFFSSPLLRLIEKKGKYNIK